MAAARVRWSEVLVSLSLPPTMSLFPKSSRTLVSRAPVGSEFSTLVTLDTNSRRTKSRLREERVSDSLSPSIDADSPFPKASVISSSSMVGFSASSATTVSHAFAWGSSFVGLLGLIGPHDLSEGWGLSFARGGSFFSMTAYDSMLAQFSSCG